MINPTNQQLRPLSDAALAAINQQLSGCGYQLAFADDVLQLLDNTHQFRPLWVDFVSGKSRHRRLFGGGRQQPLARAIGLKPGFNPSVLDLTAGMGRDAFVLATLGCEVTMLERSAVIAALLQDGLRRGLQDSDTAAILGHLQLREVDSGDYLEKFYDVAEYDVIYLDPMYPHRGKSALVKKEMRMFREVVGEDADSSRLLALARKVCGRRVVVKRPKTAGWLDAACRPAFAISSKNTRYDVYLPDHA